MSNITTPFGRGRYDSSRFATQLAARAAIWGEGQAQEKAHGQTNDQMNDAASAQPQDRSNQPAAVHKWRLLRALTEGRERLDLGERALTVLSALLSFHPETVLCLPKGTGRDPGQAARDLAGQDLAGQDMPPTSPGNVSLVVFPSNRELSLRAQGLGERTLARHLAALADAGLIIRCDSPNGKRYARKGRDGTVQTAFGFDLTPLVLRAAEFEDAADLVRQQAARMRALRERCTLARRSAAGLLALAEAEAAVGPWDDYATLLAGLTVPRRRAACDELTALATSYEALVDDISAALQTAMNTAQPHKESGSARYSDSHQQSSKIEDTRIELASEKARSDVPLAQVPSWAPEAKSASRRPLALGLVRQACPALAEWAGESPRDWPAFIRAAHVARAALGVSLDGWLEAVEAMGEQVAAATVAAILERVEQAQSAKAKSGREVDRGADQSGHDCSVPGPIHQPPALIRSPGGYLRSLSAKARAGTFRPEPFLMALMATRGRA